MKTEETQKNERKDRWVMIDRGWHSLSDEEKNKIIKHQQEYPVKPAKIAKEFGLSVKAATLPVGVSGEIKKESNGDYVIRVDRHEIVERQRFTVAHEIAHFLLHRDVIGDGLQDSPMYRSSLSDAREREANTLASGILLPKNLILKGWQDIEEEKDVATKIEELAKKLGVSKVTIQIRLGLG